MITKLHHVAGVEISIDPPANGCGFSFWLVNMPVTCPNACRILTVEYNILLSRSFDKICCIVNVELHPDYNI